MLKTLSPYYINIPLSDGGIPFTSYNLNIFIWTGLQSAKPSTPEYDLTRDNPTQSIGEDKVNIANMINDFIEFTPQKATSTSLINGVNQLWINVSYEGFIGVIPMGEVELLTDIAISGYTGGMEGENAQPPTNKIYLQGDEFNVNRKSSFIVPLYADGTNATIISTPNNEINQTINVPTTTDSNSIVSYLWVQCSESTTDKNIQITYNGSSVYLYLTDEYRYEPIDIHFKNKEGVQQVLTFFKERRNNLTVKGESYNGNAGQPLNGYHQKVDYNKNSNTTFTVNSGFVEEEMNETFHQLLVSDAVWVYENDLFIPVNIGSTSLEYKSQVNDKLINYAIKFEYSFDDINNI